MLDGRGIHGGDRTAPGCGWAAGVVSSSGDDTPYGNLQIRFLDGDGVRVESATDSISELEVGESARWDASTYRGVRSNAERCEVTATVG